MCSLLVSDKIVKQQHMNAWTFFKKGLLAFKTTLKISPVSTFHWKKKRNNAFAILTSYCTISSTPDDTTEEGFLFSTGRNGQNSQTELLWVKFRVKTQSLLDGAPVSMKRCISFIQIQIHQCRIVNKKKTKNKRKKTFKFLHKVNSSFPPPETTSRQILRKQSK